MSIDLVGSGASRQLPVATLGKATGAGAEEEDEAAFAQLLETLFSLSRDEGRSPTSVGVRSGEACPSGDEPVALARIFNELGFFHAVGAPRASEAVPARANAAAAPAVLVLEDAGVSPAPSDAVLVSERSSPAAENGVMLPPLLTDLPAASGREGGRTALAAIDAGGGAAPAPASPAVATTPGVGGRLAPAGGPEAPGGSRSWPAARLAPENARAEQSMDVQLVVQPSDEGLRLLARVGKLNREERSRLRSEIAQLLLRHGFTSGEIVLNGEPEPRRPL